MTKFLWQPLLGLILLTLVTLFLPLTHAQASGFFSASVPVASQSVRERDRAAKEGLRQVLVRLSGTVELEQYPQAISALNRASTYVEQFSYEQVRGATGPAVEHLVMTFSPSAVEKLLQSASLPYWPVQRPTTLVWLVVDDITEGKLLVNDANDPVLQGLFSAGQARGLPLLLPLLDLDDQLAISAEKVWNLDQEAVLTASERYGTDTVLIGRYSRTSVGEWWTSWQFFHRGDGHNFDLRGEDGILVGQQALAPLADHLAGLYALKANREAAVQLFVQVSPADNFGTYRKTLDYLHKLPVLTSFNLLAVTEESLLFSFQLNGTFDQLKNTLALDAKLRPQQSGSPDAPWLAVPGGSADQPWRLEWIGR
jgi:hypothetical protein